MDIPRYDTWLHWVVTERCDLRCVYCYHQRPPQEAPSRNDASDFIRAVRGNFKKIAALSRLGIFGSIAAVRNKIREMTSDKTSETINIPALMDALDKTGRIFRVSFTGGEPFLVPNFIEACVEIAKKHYLSFNTNLVSAKIKLFCDKVDSGRVVQIHASAHIKELERLGLVDAYITNFLICKQRGINIAACEVGYPAILGEIDKYRTFFRQRGIELVFGPFCGEYNGKVYPQSYTKGEIAAFGFDKPSGLSVKYFYQKGQLCNAGYNVGIVDRFGNVRSCFSGTVIGKIYGRIKFRDKLIRCRLPFCGCPLKEYDRHLFEKAVSDGHGYSYGP
jgi:organic radical activating enzyme